MRGTITWTDPVGNASAGPGAGARPAAGSSMLVDSTRYQATAAATGYAIGDYLAHVVTLNPKTGASVGDFWINATQAAKLAAAPASANIAPISPLPTGAAKDSSVLAGNALLQALSGQIPASPGQKVAAQSLPVVLSSDGPFATNFGLTTDAAATSDAGTFGFIALFKRSLGYLGTLAGAVSSGIVQVATRSNAPRVTASLPLAAAGIGSNFSVRGAGLCRRASLRQARHPRWPDAYSPAARHPDLGVLLSRPEPPLRLVLDSILKPEVRFAANYRAKYLQSNV